ncbi:MAG: class I SAM-dependent rRNA methyltransferase [Bacteroidia bacterium]|nr:class I SAM-dependent rRNA methyltransferase [Bacteroidia bacterium]
MFPRIILKPKRDESLKRFHPWVFSGAISQTPAGLTAGDLADVYSHEGVFLGRGFYNDAGIAVRIVTFRDENLDRDFWRARLRTALALRQAAGLTGRDDLTMFRLVHGEGDGLPGLIIDIYGHLAVIQCHQIGFYRMRELLASTLMELEGLPLAAVYDKSTGALPEKPGLVVQDGYLCGQAQAWTGLEYGNHYHIDPDGSQKTGFFIDQRESRLLLQQLAAGRQVLNMFSYTGGFSIAALRGGATLVHSVDSSRKAIMAADENVALNFPQGAPHEAFAVEAFEFLNTWPRAYDLVVLDPPAFAKNPRHVDHALRGYRRLNAAALRQMKTGSLLFTFSCSQAISRDQFREAVLTAATLSRRHVRILHQLSQPADHPVSIFHPEGEYLKGLVLYVEEL